MLTYIHIYIYTYIRIYIYICLCMYYIRILTKYQIGFIDCTNSFFFCICLHKHKSQQVLGKCEGFQELVLEETDTARVHQCKPSLQGFVHQLRLRVIPVLFLTVDEGRRDFFFAFAAISQGQHGYGYGSCCTRKLWHFGA